MSNITTIRVFEAFAGYGSQAMALKRLQKAFPDSVSFEFVGISEIEPNAIKAYNAIHGETTNYGDITKINWGGQIPDFDLFTYSFPCQDISNAGLQRGFAAGSGSRSSLLWECCRCIEQKKPKYLLMENVKALVSEKFMKDFSSWAMWLEGQGYRNFWQVLNAKDYGVPQNRERVFMVSILDCTDMYIFPKSFKLEKRLKDVLEDNVDESFYLSDERVNSIIEHTERHKEKGNGFSHNFTTGDSVCSTILSAYGSRETDTYLKEDAAVVQVGQMYGAENNSQRGRVYSPNGISPCLMSHEQGAGIEPKIIQVEKGFNKVGVSVHPLSHAMEFDGMKDVKKDVAPCLRATDYKAPHCVWEQGVEYKGKLIKEGDGLYTDTSDGFFRGGLDGVSRTLKAETHDAGTCVNCCGQYRIRKLTPRECFRLMDCTEEDIDKIQAADISKSAQYRLAGNSIVVACLYHIFRKMFVEKHTDPGQVVQLSLF